jgi:hypothetical protein
MMTNEQGQLLGIKKSGQKGRVETTKPFATQSF